METGQILDSHLANNTRFKDNYQRKNNVIKVFYLFMALTVVSFAFDFFEYFKDSDQLSDEFYSEDLSTSDYLVLPIFFGYLFCYVACVITFIQWFRRAYWNLHSAKISSLKHSEGMAAGSWFIPFLNLFYPYQIMKEIWDKMQGYLASTLEDYTIQKTNIIITWWLLFIVNNTLGRIATRTSLKAETVEAYLTSIEISMVHSIFQIIALVVAVNLIKKTATIEENFYKYFQE